MNKYLHYNLVEREGPLNVKAWGHKTFKSLPDADVDATRFTCPFDTVSFIIKL